MTSENQARDFESHQLGYWLPLIGVLCDKNHLQFFLYDSSDRRFYASDPLTHFAEHQTELEFLMSIRISNTPLLHSYISAILTIYSCREIPRPVSPLPHQRHALPHPLYQAGHYDT